MNNLTNISDIIDFCGYLSKRKISFKLSYAEDDTINVIITLPGKRIEVSFFKDAVLFCTFSGDEAFDDDLESLVKFLESA